MNVIELRINVEKKFLTYLLKDTHYIALSIDGWFGSSIHDLTRGGTKNGEILKAVINAVNLLKVAKENINSNTPKIFVNSIIMSDNFSDLVKIVEWSKNENLDGITFQPIA